MGLAPEAPDQKAKTSHMLVKMAASLQAWKDLDYGVTYLGGRCKVEVEKRNGALLVLTEVIFFHFLSG